MDKKLVIKIAVLAVVVITVGHYIWAKTTYLDFINRKLSKYQLCCVKDETTDWKTYRSYYGFEIKYPSNIINKYYSQPEEGISDLIRDLGALVYVEDVKKYKSLKEYEDYIKNFEQENNKLRYQSTLYKEEILDGKQVFFQNGPEIGIGGPTGSFFYNMYIWIEDGRVITIASGYSDEEQRQLLEKSYYSIKFTK